MKNKKSRVLLIALAVIMAISAIGATAAYMFNRAEAVENNFTPAEVTCKVLEQFDGTEKSSIAVENTSNIDAYVRVRLVSYWVNEEGNIVGKASVMPDVDYNSELWYCDEEHNTYYCKTPVKVGEKSPELLASPIILKEEVESGKTFYQVVEVFAEAIQAEGETAFENGISAFEEMWGKQFN